jgi:hypothetical protein
MASPNIIEKEANKSLLEAAFQRFGGGALREKRSD